MAPASLFDAAALEALAQYEDAKKDRESGTGNRTAMRNAAVRAARETLRCVKHIVDEYRRRESE
jgi:hypothetical protein